MNGTSTIIDQAGIILGLVGQCERTPQHHRRNLPKYLVVSHGGILAMHLMSPTVTHSEMWHTFRHSDFLRDDQGRPPELIAAGSFCPRRLVCFGGSRWLHVGSRPEEDTRLLRQLMQPDTEEAW